MFWLEMEILTHSCFLLRPPLWWAASVGFVVAELPLDLKETHKVDFHQGNDNLQQMVMQLDLLFEGITATVWILLGKLMPPH